MKYEFMKIIFIQTYPVYHDGISDADWLKLENRDKWMPSIAASLGYESELWAVSKKRSEHLYRWNSSVTVPIRIFPADSLKGRSKKHVSSELIDIAKEQKDVHFFLKGLDGGIGTQLLKEHLLQNQIPWSFIVGGEYISRHSSNARFVLCETEKQRDNLLEPSILRKLFLSSTCNKNAHILPKSVDTDLFKPDPTATKEWDILAIGRLMNYYKDYSALDSLSRSYRVAVIGGGASEKLLKSKMPAIEWIGHLPHHQIPQYLVKAKTFFHTSLNDHFPRVIPEAASCGTPVIAFANAIERDVLSPEIGLRIKWKTMENDISELLSDEYRLRQMGENAARYATDQWNKLSTLPLLKKLLEEL